MSSHFDEGDEKNQQKMLSYMDQAKAYVVNLLSKECDGSQVYSEDKSDPVKNVFKLCEDLCTAATDLPLCEVWIVIYCMAN